jgi:hypothetical protein
MSTSLYRVKPETLGLPLELSELIEPGDEVWKCSYCGLVWSQSTASYPGFDPTLIARYDDKTMKFFPFRRNFPVHPDNKPR